MTTSTILLIILSLAVAAGLSFYQYFYKAGQRNKIHLWLALLRFVALFGLLLLLINPVVSRKTFETQKTPLAIAVDNSASVTDLKADKTARDLYRELAGNKQLRDKFDIQPYVFADEFEPMTAEGQALDFKGSQTNIDLAAKNLKTLHKNKTFPTVLITDGNQTSGNDYVYGFDPNNKVFPLVLGDTATVMDLRIGQLNVNKYAFHKNKFPVEVFLQYSGNKPLTANFSIAQGGTVYHKQTVAFSSSKRSAVVNVLLPADRTGLQVFKASVASPVQEKNTYNNAKNFAVEVIDQRTEIAIVSTISHPDIGALKRAIESNPQRKVTIVKPQEIKSLSDYNVLVLYQPNPAFKPLLDQNKTAGVNTFVVTGTATDFQFLNLNQNQLVFRMSGQSEDYLPSFESQFNLFALDDIGFDNLPPLQNAFGTVTVNGSTNVLLSSRIRNIATGAPLLAFAENQGKRAAFLLGENSWKWRLQSHVDHQSFEKYDVFIDKIIQFLASNNARKSLVVNHESFYNSGEAIEITAQFFNKNYEFDEKAQLSISLTHKATSQTKHYDLLKTNNAYKVNLDGLAAGQYQFAVRERNSKTTYNGYFEILDFDIEKQFVNPDLGKLQQLATQTQGQVFVPNQLDALVKQLLEDQRYQAVQKAIAKKTPLIEWVWLLVIIAAALATEWFVRKYHGML
ncbi:hypothetical protein [Flavobacterium caeni]|uniref:VWA domain-containing protein n=1 Tax=Flavobacterium caeni TaxID=490189 RepID=A0A1G5D2K7_9FLAO|nr:hypothetical protein [Flavobacterium caeni]SCY08915.1 hypothetical protein SAMN02927903_00722 [Flavobacterium caeni]